MDFPTTRLSMVRAAASPGLRDTRSQAALADLYRLYWPPLYAFVRRMGYDHDHAEDLTQGFITRMIEKNALQFFHKERGRFRTFLLASLKHYLANERAASRALKRGGELASVPLDDAGPVRDDWTPEKVFERRWAVELLQRTMGRLREEYTHSSNGLQFERLRTHLAGDAERVPYREMARDLGMTEGAVKVAMHRMRQRFHEALREEVAQTVTHPEEVGDEIRYLLAAIGGQ